MKMEPISLIAKRLIQHNRVFVFLFILDLLIVLAHIFLGKENHFFHMDFEQNLPTYYQSLKLIGFGCLFLLMGVSKRIPLLIKSFVIPLALSLTFWGLDELLQIHENIYRIFELFDLFHPSKIVEASMRMGYRSSLWILYYIPVIFIFIFWSGYWLRYLQSKMKSVVWMLALASFCLFMVLLAEIVSSTGTYSESNYFWLITLEEMAEMFFASLLILVGKNMLQADESNSQSYK